MKRAATNSISCALFVLIFVININTVEASHIMGGDITYSCISNGQYAIQVKLFRDCDGITLGNNITINLSSATCGNYPITLPLLTSHPQVVSQLCPTWPDLCNNDPGATYGVEEYIYKGIIDMNAAPINGCQASDWVLSWSSCCRNNNITTLQGPTTTGTYLYSNLDNTATTAPCNSSPDFLTRPTAVFCVNQPVFYNHGVVDPDGDSLVFSLTDCMEVPFGSTVPVNVTYQGALSGTNPLIATGFSIDPATGAISFTPTAIQTGVLCMRVEEFRNGVKIGETYRDMQFEVINCNNTPPILAGLDNVFGGSFDTTICADDFITFNIQSADPDTNATPNQSVSMNWNGGIVGGIFTVDTSGTVPNGTFSWTPSNQNAGINTFTVTVGDDACPIKGQNIFTYTITVLERPPVDLGNTQVLCGSSDSVTLTATIDPSQTWSTSPVSYTWSPTVGLADPTAASTMASPDSTVEYTVTVVYDNGCSSQSSVVVEFTNGLDLPPLSDTTVCGGSLQLDVTIPNLDTSDFFFENTTTMAVPDGDPITGVFSDITVSGVSPAAINNNSIVEVCFAANHFFAGDLDVYLIAPNGDSVELTTDNGGISVPGAFSDTTCFSMSASTLISAAGGTLLNGTYIPEGNFNTLNGIPVNGLWRLWVRDDATGVPDSLTYFSITFGNQNTITYSWFPTDSLSCSNCPDPIATPIQTTTYTVTAIDQNGCADTDSMTIFVPANLPAPIINCDATNPNTIVFCWDTIPNSLGYEVSLDTGATWITPNTGTLCHTVTGLSPNTDVMIQVQGVSACSNVTIGVGSQVCTSDPCTVVGTIVSITDATCANDGTASINGSGGHAGMAGYTYVLSDITNPIPPIATQINDGNFNGLAAGNYIVAIIDSFQCADTVSFTINQSTAITAMITTDSVSCKNGNNGTATVVASGGAGGFSYSWSNTNTTATITNLTAGMYIVTITDANSCTLIDTAIVGEPDAMILTTTGTNPTCVGGNDGTASVSVANGAGGYTYLWSNSDVTAMASNLSAGTHFVTVTDANGCTETTSVTISDPVAIVLTTTPTNVGCFGGNDGTATVSVVGGTAPYTYLWSNGDITAMADTLSAGTYSVTVTDAISCFTVANVTISQPPTGMTATMSKTDVTCNGGADGTATVLVVGGSGTYSYAWSNGEQTPMASNLSATDYSVTVTDVNGCFIVENVTIDEPTVITLIVGQTATSCHEGNDGTATVVGSGGTPNSANSYSFIWNTVPPQFGATAIGLRGGETYSVIATDINGCVAQSNVTVNQPNPIALSTTQTNVTCDGFSDGQVDVLASGGIPGYTYAWSNGNSASSVLSNALAGNYTVTVTDINGCTQSTNVTISEPNPLQINLSVEDVACKGEKTGKAIGLAAGGTPFYNFTWDDRANNQTGIEAVNLAAGTYAVTLTDANGCAMVDSVVVTEPAEAIRATMATTDVSCYGDRDGQININAAGGAAPYEYSSNGVNWTGAFNLVGLTAGEYTSYVRDANGCVVSDKVTISEPAELLVDAGPDVYVEYGEQIALVTNIQNGVLPYRYEWTPPAGLSCADCPIPMASPELDEYYTFMVTDAKGCVATDEVIVRVEKERGIYVATAFSPNDDGTNDALYIQGSEAVSKVKDFKVYDRWGELVFHTTDIEPNDPEVGWNGKFKGTSMNSSVYVWSAEIEFSDGSVLNYKGNTTLVR